jgi:hypothetical protein
MLAEAARQLDRIFQRQLGARADRIMRVCAASPISTTGTAVPVHPLAADDAREGDPHGRAAQVGGVGHQLVAIELLGKQRSQKAIDSSWLISSSPAARHTVPAFRR